MNVMLRYHCPRLIFVFYMIIVVRGVIAQQLPDQEVVKSNGMDFSDVNMVFEPGTKVGKYKVSKTFQGRCELESTGYSY